MRFAETRLRGVFVIEQERRHDERGFFARTFCQREFAERGLCERFVQTNVSFNIRKGTLRGLHFQADPHGEVKLVTCTRGRVWDVVVDVRPGSSTFGEHVGVELDEASGRAIYIPEGFAHGFQTLEENSMLLYQMGSFYEASAARGVRFDDPSLAVRWPLPDPFVGERDRQLPSWAEISSQR